MRALAASALVMLLAGCAAPASLGVIDNVLSHEGPPPPSPPIVRELLANPLDALDAQAIFDRTAPASLARLAQPPRQDLEPSIERFLDELAEAQRALRAAVPALPPLEARMPPPPLQRQIAASIDPAPFLEAIARFLRQRIVYPDGGARFERGDVTVVFGTPGDDVHELEPLRDGAVRVLVDPGGNDVYRGPDVVLHGLAAIVDLDGDDRYESEGPAWGAAIAGVSLLLDASGNDVYGAQDFSIGAALSGLGAVLDLSGDDRYRVRAFGQGLGLARGTGILWDRAGNDHYHADGLPDPFDRGGGLSFAQGVAVGVRTGTGGGIGILRDDAGDDAYEGQLYAQGAGYYYALGLLWDLGGKDRYVAARYAQGAGVHQAVGVLRDESGDDAYELSVGVGQGMGLDLAVGVLADAAGDDRYSAPTLAQGAATANGVGILSDRDGRNTWQLKQPPGRGRAAWARDLPSVGLLLADAPRFAAMPRAEATEPAGACPAEADAEPADMPLAQALRELGPGFVRGAVDPARYALALRELRERPAASLAGLPAQDFDSLWPLGLALRCALAGANDVQAQAMWDAFEQVLREDPASRFAGVIAGALRARPAPAAQMQRLVARLGEHPSCGIRVAALSLDGSEAAAQEALRSSCWQLQARALRMLESLGARPVDLSGVPRFLRSTPASRPAP
jgi:hypothetical protein